MATSKKNALRTLWSHIKQRFQSSSRKRVSQNFARSSLALLRRLEPKRVLTVTPTFAANILTLNYDADPGNQATLFTNDGATFRVDTDGNLLTFELSGAINQLFQIDVNGNGGSFTWNGDFSAANNLSVLVYIWC